MGLFQLLLEGQAAGARPAPEPSPEELPVEASRDSPPGAEETLGAATAVDPVATPEPVAEAVAELLEPLTVAPAPLARRGTLEKALTLPSREELARPLEPVPEGFSARAASPHTRRAFDSDARAYAAWCGARSPHGAEGFDAEPERAVASHLYWMARAEFVDRHGRAQVGHKLTTIERRLTGLVDYYRGRRVRFDRRHPAIEEALSNIRGALAGTAQASRDQARPLRLADLESFFAALEWWDRALLAIGFWGAMRQDEARSLLFEDVALSDRGLSVRLRVTKTTRRLARVVYVGIPRAVEHVSLCAARAWETFLERTSRRSGYVFTGPDGRTPVSSRYVGRLIKRTAELTGAPTEVVEALSSHSMRRGAATLISRKGLEVVMRQTRHASAEQARTYVAAESVFDDNPLDGII